jgi:4-hydroxy-4-methyl-2-oxoglutarate aldolase
MEGSGMSVVISNPPHLAQQVAEGFAPYGVATVDETQGRTGLLASFVRPIYAGAKIPGSAATVSFPPADYWMLDVAVEQCQAGDVLVLATTSSPCDTDYFGERLACSLARAACSASSSRSG